MLHYIAIPQYPAAEDDEDVDDEDDEEKDDDDDDDDEDDDNDDDADDVHIYIHMYVCTCHICTYLYIYIINVYIYIYAASYLPVKLIGADATMLPLLSEKMGAKDEEALLRFMCNSRNKNSNMYIIFCNVFRNNDKCAFPV